MRELGAALAAALAAATVLSGHAAAPAERTLAAELQIVAADLERLRTEDLSAPHRRGLSNRVRGSLSYLPVLARRWTVIAGAEAEGIVEEVRGLRHRFEQANYDGLQAALDELVHRVPLDITGLRVTDASAKDRAEAGEIYRTLCRGCHEQPDLARENPAYDLFEQARSVPAREFIARLLGGVRGTPEIGLENPLTDRELAGLYAYLKNQ
ncbi:MAG: cytochrome c [Gammaproteobacteria bacterium]|nr:cytochrome c [Gammaproteobacteria bacterium]